MVILHDEAYYKSREPQPDLGFIKNVLRFIWNKDRRTFLDRTAKEWGQLGLFYMAFFSVLVSIFAIQLKISIDFVSDLDKPYLRYSEMKSRSIIGKRFAIFHSPWQFDNPGIVFKPNSASTASPIILISNASIDTMPDRYIRALSDFFQDYNKNASEYDSNCQNKSSELNHPKESCFFDIRELRTCNKPPYGYEEPMQPCVLIKFNKRFDWMPECYNQSSILPENMPDDLKKLVQESDKLMVWLSCDGVNNVDKEHIGEVEYIPKPGFSAEYFPFIGQLNYTSPIVALRFKNLTLNRLVTIECNLWAANIELRSRHTLDFQIMIVN